jgi:hypothetical protein
MEDVQLMITNRPTVSAARWLPARLILLLPLLLAILAACGPGSGGGPGY